MTDPITNPAAEEDFDPVAEIENLKQNTVSKDDYNKLKADNAKLMKALISGGQMKDTNKPTVEDMRKTLYKEYDTPKTNLAFVTTLLDLRDAEMASGKQDIFLANSADYSPTQNDIAEAEHVATVLRKCVDDANGDAATFNDLLRRSMR